jgi:hypothetical protein
MPAAPFAVTQHLGAGGDECGKLEVRARVPEGAGQVARVDIPGGDLRAAGFRIGPAQIDRRQM